jgi:site-specific DNA-methyltransferase (adenine-specific)
MPESVRDRCTKAHEYVFLLTKSERYYYDAEAVSEASILGPHVRSRASNFKKAGSEPLGRHLRGAETIVCNGTRNRRSVWTVTTKPYSGAHFAVMPAALVEPCIKAGCPEGGTVLDPFAGSGTTLAVAAELGRSGVGCELNPEYIRLAERRIKDARESVALFEGVPA